MTPVSGDEKYRQSLAESHRGMALGLAKQLSVAYSLPGYVREEMESMALEGLAQAAARYDPSRGTAFSTFAYYRVRGAVLDGLRRMGLVRQQAAIRREASVDAILEASEPVRPATLEEAVADLADTLGEVAFLEAYFPTEVSARDADRIPDEDVPDTEEVAADREARRFLADALAGLDEREQRLMSLVYFQGWTLAEAGRQLGLSRSWACRIHRKAVARLRKKLEEQGISRGDF